MLVVDGRTAFLGGINISEPYSSGSLSPSKKKDKKGAESDIGWRDTHLQIEGPVVAEFQQYFMDTWAAEGSHPGQQALFPQARTQGDEVVRAIGSEADSEDVPIYLTLLSAVARAERNIHLTIAYFVPDPQLRAALIEAAQRGVDVQIILPGKNGFLGRVSRRALALRQVAPRRRPDL